MTELATRRLTGVYGSGRSRATKMRPELLTSKLFEAVEYSTFRAPCMAPTSCGADEANEADLLREADDFMTMDASQPGGQELL